jgi:hypothetical protein
MFTMLPAAWIATLLRKPDGPKWEIVRSLILQGDLVFSLAVGDTMICYVKIPELSPL